jgi:repressor of nif and glnA expression
MLTEGKENYKYFSRIKLDVFDWTVYLNSRVVKKVDMADVAEIIKPAYHEKIVH